jgi:hypothetical protein
MLDKSIENNAVSFLYLPEVRSKLWTRSLYAAVKTTLSGYDLRIQTSFDFYVNKS